MGRYYSGEIEGKFWFGTQDSLDASHFGIEHDVVYVFRECHCRIVEDKDIEALDNSSFCQDCYSSLEEHRQAIADEEGEGEGEEQVLTWKECDYEVDYHFQEEHIPIVQEKVHELYAKVGQYMDSYAIVHHDFSLEYTFDLPKDVDEDEQILLARLCLGKQILYCLQTRGSCSFTAEL
jgi:hypothetical protein